MSEEFKPPTKDQIQKDREQYEWRYIPDRDWTREYYQLMS